MQTVSKISRHEYSQASWRMTRETTRSFGSCVNTLRRTAVLSLEITLAVAAHGLCVFDECEAQFECWQQQKQPQRANFFRL
jgi:hypothetical protein